MNERLLDSSLESLTSLLAVWSPRAGLSAPPGGERGTVGASKSTAYSKLDSAPCRHISLCYTVGLIRMCYLYFYKTDI